MNCGSFYLELFSISVVCLKVQAQPVMESLSSKSCSPIALCQRLKPCATTLVAIAAMATTLGAAAAATAAVPLLKH